MVKILTSIILLLCSQAYCQVAMPFAEAREKTIYPKVDSIFKSAIDTDRSKAVFKTDAEVEAHTAAYRDFLTAFGVFLLESDFEWDVDTRCFNRIYLNEDGSVAYFLYDFKTALPEKREKEFRRLLNLFIKDHQFCITAPGPFAQCSPVTYPKTR